MISENGRDLVGNCAASAWSHRGSRRPEVGPGWCLGMLEACLEHTDGGVWMKRHMYSFPPL